MPNKAGMVMGIIGGILSILMSLLFFFSPNESMIFFGFLIVIGAIISFSGSANVKSDPSLARILLIVGGIVSLGNLITIIGGALIRLDEEFDSKSGNLSVITCGTFIIIFSMIALIVPNFISGRKFYHTYIELLIVIACILIFISGIIVIKGGSYPPNKETTKIGGVLGLIGLGGYIISILFYLPAEFKTRNMFEICFAIVILLLLIISMNIIKEKNQ